MNFLEALKSGKRMRLPGVALSVHNVWGYGCIVDWASPEQAVSATNLTPSDMLSDKWEIEEPSIELTATGVKGVLCG